MKASVNCPGLDRGGHRSKEISPPGGRLGRKPPPVMFLCICVMALLLDSAFALDKNSYYELYNEIFRNEDWEMGEARFREAAKEYPEEIAFHIYLNIFLRNQEKREQALLQIEPLYRMYPDDPALRVNYGASLLAAGWEKVEKGEKQQAHTLFQQAYTLNPGDEWNVNAYGYILNETGHTKESIHVLEEGYRKHSHNDYIKGNYISSLLRLGWVKAENGEKREALPLFTKAYELDPENEWSLNAYGHILRELGELQESIAVLEKGYARYGQNEYIRGNLIASYYVLANELRDKNDLALAERYYVKARRIDPDDEWLLLNYGYFLRLKGEFAAALKTCERGFEIYPVNKYFRPNILTTYYEYGKSEAGKENLDRAISILKQAAREFPDEVWLPAFISDYYTQKKEHLSAAEYIIRMAMIKDRRGLVEDAGVNLETSICNRMTGALYYIASEGDFDAGFNLIDRFEEHFTDKFYIHQLRGVLKYHSGQKEAGLDLVYRAYDLYIAKHPEYREPVVIPLPVKGIYRVGGNSSSEAITHAGMNRFCFDFLGCTGDGRIRRTESEDMGRNEDYIGFGDLLYSPVDGVVEEVTDDEPDLRPAKEYRLIDGNRLIVKDEKGLHYVFIHNHGERI